MWDVAKAAAAYGFSETHIFPVQQDVWKVFSGSGAYCLKVMEKSEERVAYIIAAMEHLLRQGFPFLPQPAATVEGQPFLKAESGIWLATTWIEGEKCLFRQAKHLEAASNTLGLFHNAARDFTKPGGRVSYEAWPGRLARQGADLGRFFQLASEENSYFCRRYLLLADSQRMRAEKALALLAASDYQALAAEAAISGRFVHRDVAGRNFIIDKDGIAHLIDYDYCRYDLPAVDMVRLLERGLLEEDCREETVDLIFREYSRCRHLSPNEMGVITALLYFPQRYWRLGQRYFKEMPGARDEMRYGNQMDWLIYHNKKEEKCLEYILKHYGGLG